MVRIDVHARSLSVAPMMDWTDRHCRFFHRLLAPRALLYTEMITSGAILHGDRDALLGFNPEEHPVALQLGGSDPEELARCAQIAAARGFDEINLNVGCPSDRVQRGRFGACLMLEPELVRDCVAAMRAVVDIPVTVKTRLGVDDHDSFDYFRSFLEIVAGSGCEVFIVHARKAWLSGLSPRENREIPELRYHWVHRVKNDYPGWTIVLNGGLDSVSAALQQQGQVDGVMLGRAAYQNPWILAQLSLQLGHVDQLPDRLQIVRSISEYAERKIAQGAQLNHISRHVLGLFQGLPGARRWRRTLSEQAHRPGASAALLLRAAAAIQPEDLQQDAA